MRGVGARCTIQDEWLSTSLAVQAWLCERPKQSFPSAAKETLIAVPGIASEARAKRERSAAIHAALIKSKRYGSPSRFATAFGLAMTAPCDGGLISASLTDLR